MNIPMSVITPCVVILPYAVVVVLQGLEVGVGPIVCDDFDCYNYSKCEYDYTRFKKCSCENCPILAMIENADVCERCLEEQMEKYGCLKGCEVWIVTECDHTTCSAFQTSEETPDDEDECADCYMLQYENS